MLHTTRKNRPSLHSTLTFALVQSSYLFTPDMSLGADGLPQPNFTLRTGLPEKTFRSLADTGLIAHKQHGVFGAQDPMMTLPFYFYYQSVRMGNIDWFVIYDLGQPEVMAALTHWRTENCIHAVFEQSSGTYEDFLFNPCIGEQCFYEAARSDAPTMRRIETLIGLLQANGREVRALLDAPSTQVMVVSAGTDYERHLKSGSSSAQHLNGAARRSKK